VNKGVGRLVNVSRIRVAGALSATPDLQHQLSGRRELEDHVVGVAFGRGLGPSTVATDPDEPFRIDVDPVLAFRPFVALTRPTPTPQQLSRRVEFQDRRSGVRAPVRGNRSRPVQHPDVIA
jgi:hypothetical protein